MKHAIIITLLLLAGCYSQDEKLCAWRGREAADNLAKEQSDDPRVKQVKATIDASVARLGTPNPIPDPIDWELPKQIDSLKTTAAKLKESPEKARLEAQITILKERYEAEKKMLKLTNSRALEDAQRDGIEKGIEQARGLATTAEKSGVPWLETLGGLAAGVLGAAGLGYRKIKQVRKEAEGPLIEVIKAVESAPDNQALKDTLKSRGIEELNKLVERISGR